MWTASVASWRAKEAFKGGGGHWVLGGHLDARIFKRVIFPDTPSREDGTLAWIGTRR